MDCKFVEHSISDYLAGDLPTPQALELESHLRVCPGCQALHGDFRKLITVCGALPDFEVREDLWHSLRHRLPATEAKSVFARTAHPHEDIFSLLQRKLAFYQRVSYAAVALALRMRSSGISNVVFIIAILP